MAACPANASSDPGETVLAVARHALGRLTYCQRPRRLGMLPGDDEAHSRVARRADRHRALLRSRCRHGARRQPAAGGDRSGPHQLLRRLRQERAGLRLPHLCVLSGGTSDQRQQRQRAARSSATRRSTTSSGSISSPSCRRRPLFWGAAHVGLNVVWATIVAFDTDFSSASPAPGFQLKDNGVGTGDLTTGVFLQFKPMFVGGRPIFSAPGGVRRHRADRLVRSAEGHQPELQFRLPGPLLGGHRLTGAPPGDLGALHLPLQFHQPPAGQSVPGVSRGRQRQGGAGVSGSTTPRRSRS